jgi:dihydroorotate dehydrogenase electron transfer subunit
MLRENATITMNDSLGANLFRMRIKSNGIASSWIPGQFLHILPPVTDRPQMLRRPISIYSSTNDEVEFIFRIEGDGTKLISEQKAGDKLDVIGPLGHGFDQIPDSDGVHILVGGGVGAPPMIALADFLFKLGKKVELYQGARNSADLILNEELSKKGFVYRTTTEDGSIGTKGLVTSILPDPDKTRIACAYACGPIGMMKSVLKWRGNAGFPYYVSVENKLGCGIGVCLGCSVPSIDGSYVKTCKDGPVFNADTLDWNRMDRI